MDDEDEPFNSSRPKKNTYKFYMGNNVHREVVISSDFDSGNIELVRQVNEFYYRLAAVSDNIIAYRPKKTWFYFRVRAYRNCRLKFIIENIDILLPAYEVLERQLSGAAMSVDLFIKSARTEIGLHCPHARVSFRQQSTLTQRRQQLELHIEHTFQSDQSVFFALSIPFSYEQNFVMLEQLQNQIPADSQTYFKKELMTYSTNKMMVHLVTITEREPSQSETKERNFDSNLFPQSDRAVRFDKPVVLISSRVHPGEVGSSHTLVGILKFLLDQKDLRAYILRKLFVFMIVPMLNPDGVFQGNYRMDTLRRNLNRLYANPDFAYEPQIYALRKLAEYLSNQNRMFFYLDMHGHSSSKPAFVYGNALDDITTQVESQLYCKLLSLNTKYFSYEHSNFTQQQMNAKDSNEPYSKQGCSRVCLNRIANIPHCLTLQVGLHPTCRNYEVSEVDNPQFKYKEWGYTDRIIPRGIKAIFEEIGAETMITLLDLIQKNPYSRVQSSQFRDITTLRKTIATTILQDDDRFRKLDVKAYQKVKMIDKLAQQNFTDKQLLKWAYLVNDQTFAKYDWPTPGLKTLANIRLVHPKSPRKTNKKKRPDSLSKQQVNPPAAIIIKETVEIETTDSYKQQICASFSLNVVNPRNQSSPSQFLTGLPESPEISARQGASSQMVVHSIIQQYRKELKNKQFNPDKPLLIVKELQLPKILKNIVYISDSQQKIVSKRKTTSYSPVKKPQVQLRKDVDCPSFLIGMENGAMVMMDKNAGFSLDKEIHKKNSKTSKRKLSILESLKKVQVESEAMFAKAGRQGLQQYCVDGSHNFTKRGETRLKTQNFIEQLSKSNKSTRREFVTTQPNVIEQFLQKESQRYDRMIAMQEVQDHRARNIRETKRELVNIKLRQFRKKVQDPRRPTLLPNLKRNDDNDNESEEFDDLGVRDKREQRQLEVQHTKDVKLYISSKRMAPARLT